MAKEKKNNKIMLIALGALLGYLFIDGYLNPDKSFLGFLFPAKQNIEENKESSKNKKFTLQNFYTEKNELNKTQKSSKKYELKKNPFYLPVKRNRVVKQKISLPFKVTQIVDTYVEINGEYLTVGDEVSGWKIAGIAGNTVTFKKDGQTVKKRVK